MQWLKYSSSYSHNKLERQHSPDISPNDPKHHSSMYPACVTDSYTRFQVKQTNEWADGIFQSTQRTLRVFCLSGMSISINSFQIRLCFTPSSFRWEQLKLQPPLTLWGSGWVHCLSLLVRLRSMQIWEVGSVSPALPPWEAIIMTALN